MKNLKNLNNKNGLSVSRLHQKALFEFSVSAIAEPLCYVTDILLFFTLFVLFFFLGFCLICNSLFIDRLTLFPFSDFVFCLVISYLCPNVFCIINSPFYCICFQPQFAFITLNNITFLTNTCTHKVWIKALLLV